MSINFPYYEGQKPPSAEKLYSPVDIPEPHIVLVKRKASDLKIGDIVARSSGCICRLEFLPINEIRMNDKGVIHFIQKSKNGVTMMSNDEVYIVKEGYTK